MKKYQTQLVNSMFHVIYQDEEKEHDFLFKLGYCMNWISRQSATVVLRDQQTEQFFVLYCTRTDSDASKEAELALIRLAFGLTD
jgi:hypothetical protein